MGLSVDTTTSQTQSQTIVNNIEKNNSELYDINEEESECVMDGTAAAEPKNTEELAAYIQNTLSNLQNKFTTISDGILTRVDQMANRIDNLERSIAELMTASGVDMNDVSLPNERK